MSMFDPNFDDDDDDLEPDDEGTGDNLVKNLREQLKKANKRAKRSADLEEENRTLKAKDVLREIPDLKLTDRQRDTLLREHGDGELSKEALRQTAADLGWADPPPPDVPDEEFEQHERIESAVAGAAPGTNGTLSPADVEDWPVDKHLRLKKKYPDEFEALKRGESVKIGDF